MQGFHVILKIKFYRCFIFQWAVLIRNCTTSIVVICTFLNAELATIIMQNFMVFCNLNYCLIFRRSRSQAMNISKHSSVQCSLHINTFWSFLGSVYYRQIMKGHIPFFVFLYLLLQSGKHTMAFSFHKGKDKLLWEKK